LHLATPLPGALRTLALASALFALGAGRSAQEPLLTIVQTSDSQAATEADWQRFEDVLERIAGAGQPGALLPRPIDLVLFPGDITESNASSEWVRSRGLLDTYLTANGIPFLCTPGNRDQGASAGSTQLYQQFIGSAGVWEASSASFTGQNGIVRNTGWSGLRFVGFNNSSGGWNRISDADVMLIGARVSAAAAASENVFLVGHHPHDGQGRIPLASILAEPAIVGYVRGHSGNPRAQLGLAGISNPNVWDLNTNSIVDDRDFIYYEVFPSQVRAHVVVLDANPTALPTAKIIPLVFPLQPPLVPDIGFEGGSHAGARPWPSGYAPERKLWFQGGHWFGVLWHEPSLSYRILRLDAFAQLWVDTGTSVSSTPGRSFDALADGTKLYLAGHFHSVPSAPGAGSNGQVSRYSYDAATRSYAQDAGFPVTLNSVRTETLVLAKDSTGRLWATWTEDGDVRETHTLNGNDATWSAPALLPFPGASALAPEDVSALVAFDGKLALLWTDSIGGKLACAVRSDGAAPTAWVLESALVAPGAVSDALDVAAWNGRLFVATRTPAGALRLLARAVGGPGLGSWSLHQVADAAAGLGQPLVLVDGVQGMLRVFATGVSAEGGGALGGGVVYEKDAPLGTLAFPPGRGTVVLQDGQSLAMGRATSTRQALDATSGLVVVASNELSQRGWHAFLSLGSAPVAPTADFVASPRSGDAPLLVRFTDLSSGSPTDRLWDFGDGTTSTASAPEHVYAQPGAYAVSLRVSNNAGSDTLTRAAYVDVRVPSTLVVLTPVADATAGEQNKNTNYGTNDTVRVRSQGGSSFRAFLKFDLGGLTGTLASAKLRLFVTDESTNGGNVYPVSSAWTETGLTWNNQPSLPGTSIASLGAVTAGTRKEVDLGTSVGGTGLVSLALSGGSSNLAAFGSREDASGSRPELVLAFEAPVQAPVADFAATPVAGTAPLTVLFTDLSGGPPAAWQWSFGDGTRSSQRNPSHVYPLPGRYAVTLTASNASGSSTLTRSAYVSVVAPTRGQATFHPIADARVSEGDRGANFGLATELRAKTQAGSSYQSFLKFDLATLDGIPTSARLRLFVTDESNSGGSLYRVTNGWTETSVSWSNKPSLPATPLATAGCAALGTWVEFDVSAAVLGPDQLSFALAGGTSNSVLYASREGQNPPELVIETRRGGLAEEPRPAPLRQR
jgi:PKD repeat protein